MYIWCAERLRRRRMRLGMRLTAVRSCGESQVPNRLTLRSWAASQVRAVTNRCASPTLNSLASASSFTKPRTGRDCQRRSMPGLDGPPMDIRWPPLLAVAIVTQLVSQSFACADSMLVRHTWQSVPVRGGRCNSLRVIPTLLAGPSSPHVLIDRAYPSWPHIRS